MELNTIEIIQEFPKNKAGYVVYEVTVDGQVYFAAKSRSGTWKVCDIKDITAKTRQIPVKIGKYNCGIHLISLLDRMILAKKKSWQAPLPRILGKFTVHLPGSMDN